jgi:hypothetical protein
MDQSSHKVQFTLDLSYVHFIKNNLWSQTDRVALKDAKND